MEENSYQLSSTTTAVNRESKDNYLQLELSKMELQKKNRIVLEMARTMLNEARISDRFWPQVVHTIVHILNKVLLRNNADKTPYELWKGRPANAKHFRVFGSKCYIRREDRIGK